MSEAALPPAPATTLSSGLVLTAAGAALLVVPLALLILREPRAFPVLALLVLPFRLPVSADGRTVNLLIPLYIVVAAGTLAHLSRRAPGARGQARADRGRCGDKRSSLRDRAAAALGSARGWRTWLNPRGLQWLLLGSVALYCVQASYSLDLAKAGENIAFFYLPFTLLFFLLREVRWTRELLLVCLATVVALAVVLAGVGFVEYARKSLFLNPKVVAANQYDNYFRVNSLFFDPNIYGRFLALVMIAVTVIVLWRSRRREVIACAAVLAWLLAGLVTSFSQSSLAALLLGLAVLAAWRWEVRAAVYVGGALVSLAVIGVLAAPSSFHLGLKGSSGSASNATSGRTKLISGGLELFAQRPLWGHGSGSFQRAYQRRHLGTSVANATSASHTIPITVAAEQGLIGLSVYFVLLVSAFAVLSRGAGRSPPRIAIAACFAALVLHTWTYADFLEDPLTWTLLGIGVALARAEGGERCSATSSAS